MKKTLIALMALAGVVSAADTFVFADLSVSAPENGISWNAETKKLTADTGYTLATNTGSNAQTALTFALNLTQAATYSSADLCPLITIATANNSGVAQSTYGLWLTDDGLSGRWGNDEYNTRGSNNTLAEYSGVVSIESILTGNSNVYTVNGEKYISLTLVTDKSCSNNSGDTNNVGVTTYDADGNRVWYCEALAGSSLNQFTSIELNTDYISSAAITPTLLSPTAAGTQAAMFIPEPATATLSLLALAGLAARRRRK